MSVDQMLSVQPLTPTLGAEVSGIDVTHLDDAAFAALFDVFTRHSVIFLRDQPALTGEQHLALAERFGEVHVHPFARRHRSPRSGSEGSPNSAERHPGLLPIRTTADNRSAAGNRWHSDVSCDDRPPQASILQLNEIPDTGGDTLFASMYAAYEALSPKMKGYLDGLTAHHSGDEAYRKLFPGQTADGGMGSPENDHPVIRRHPDSGRPALYVDREFTTAINGLPKEEGKSLLEFLLSHSERVNFQCRFRWSRNAIAIWDNRCVLHHAIWDYWPAQRSGTRVSVVGERPEPWILGTHTVPAEVEANTIRLTS